MNDLAMVHNQRGGVDEAVKLKEQVIEEKRRPLGAHDAKVAIAQLTWPRCASTRATSTRARGRLPHSRIEILRTIHHSDQPDLAFAILQPTLPPTTTKKPSPSSKRRCNAPSTS